MDFNIKRTLTSGLDQAKKLLSGTGEAIEKAGQEVLDLGAEAAHMTGDAFQKTGEAVASGSKSLAELVSQAKDQLLEEGKDALGLAPFDSEITRNPLDANEDPVDAVLDAENSLKSASTQEEASLKKLSSEDQSAFKRVADRISNDPRARLALQHMLLEGKLPGNKDLAGGKSLLENLKKLADQPVADGLDRSSLLNDTVQEIADPSCIDQQARNTCGATTAQILFARQNPAEYVRVVAGLASPEGKVKIQSGDTLERKPDWNAEDGGRTISSKLLQPAFMDQSNGKLFAYDNTKDGRSIAGKGSVPGMLPNEMADLLKDLTGKNYQHFESISLAPSDAIKFAVFRSKLDQAAPGHEVPVMVNYAGKDSLVVPHWLLVTGVKDGFVNYVNPWGQEEKLPVKEFNKHLIAYVPEG